MRPLGAWFYSVTAPPDTGWPWVDAAADDVWLVGGGPMWVAAADDALLLPDGDIVTIAWGPT